jgi:lipopolysaccharide export system permease protein
MMIGVVIGMGFNIVDKIAGHIGLIYDLNPALMAVTPSFTVLVLALWALRQAKY